MCGSGGESQYTNVQGIDLHVCVYIHMTTKLNAVITPARLFSLQQGAEVDPVCSATLWLSHKYLPAYANIRQLPFDRMETNGENEAPADATKRSIEWKPMA